MTAVDAVREWAPLHRTAPDWPETDGDVAADLATDLGWELDDVQRFVVDACLADDGTGLPACGDVAVVGPRQTVGKTVALQVAALADVFLFDVGLHVWTAHRYSTAEKTFQDMQRRIMAHRDYARRARFENRTGQQSIMVDGGGTLEFHARSGKAGRGFPGVSRLTLDEWLFGRPGDVGALAPTMVTRADGQIGDPGCALNARDLWWQANSGLWVGRVREQELAKQRRTLDATEFAREFLSWWEDPPADGGGALDAGRFAGLADPDAARGKPVWFGVAVAPDRGWAAVAVAWRRPAGGVHVQVTDYRPHATWLGERVGELRRRWGGTVIVDSRARTLIAEAREPSEQDQALAEAALSDAVTAGSLSHGNSPELLTAVAGAVWQQAGAHRRLVSSGTLDITPVKAAALAVHGASSAANPLAQVW